MIIYDLLFSNSVAHPSSIIQAIWAYLFVQRRIDAGAQPPYTAADAD